MVSKKGNTNKLIYIISTLVIFSLGVTFIDAVIQPPYFLKVAIYITFFNSLLEEFFFRGFGFITLKKYVNRTVSYLVSPVLFAIYHMGMTFGSYDLLILCVMMSGLFAGGIIFNFLNEKYGNIYQSWFVHMAADAAIMTVGAVLFGIV